jgi:hypothetical protein
VEHYGLLIHNYGDAKKLTLSAYSFPSRIVVGKITTAFSFNNSNYLTVDGGFGEGTELTDFQYLCPSTHKEFLECIVDGDRERLAHKLTIDAMALFIRCNGSVDRTQIDKIYVMVKVITRSG